MKNLIFTKACLTLLIIIGPLLIKAQDVIVKIDKTEIKAKVLELTDLEIKYKKAEMVDGPTYSIKKTLVFMIIYSNGNKEYMDAAPAAPAPNNPPHNNSVVLINQSPVVKVNDDKIDDSSLSFALNSGGDTYDVEYTWFNRKNTPGKLGFGLDGYHTLSATPGSGGYYFYLAYKYSFDKAHNFSVWANAGYNISLVDSYYAGNFYIPSSSSSGYLWEVGASYFFTKWLGATAYTTQGTSEWFGLVLR